MYYVKAEQLESVAKAWYYTAGYRDGILRNASMHYIVHIFWAKHPLLL